MYCNLNSLIIAASLKIHVPQEMENFGYIHVQGHKLQWPLSLKQVCLEHKVARLTLSNTAVCVHHFSHQ